MCILNTKIHLQAKGPSHLLHKPMTQPFFFKTSHFRMHRISTPSSRRFGKGLQQNRRFNRTSDFVISRASSGFFAFHNSLLKSAPKCPFFDRLSMLLKNGIEQCDHQCCCGNNPCNQKHFVVTFAYSFKNERTDARERSHNTNDHLNRE